MDITIKHIKPTLLLLLAFLTLSSYSTNQDGVKIEKIPANFQAEIAEAFKEIEKITEKHRLDKDKKKFFDDFQKQQLKYLQRKCLTLCSERPFDEEWSYKTGAREKSIDEAKTLKTNDLYKKPDVRRRFQACFIRFREKNYHDTRRRIKQAAQEVDNTYDKLKKLLDNFNDKRQIHIKSLFRCCWR